VKRVNIIATAQITALGSFVSFSHLKVVKKCGVSTVVNGDV
jgi:hypothetical protein